MSLIRDDQIQAGLISYLKSKDTITSLVTGTYAVEIREDQWQGTQFTYPAVRVRLIRNTPTNNAGCRHEFVAGILVFSEEASSRECDQIAGIIGEELHGIGFDSNNVAFVTQVTDLVPAIRSDVRVWRSEVLIRGSAS